MPPLLVFLADRERLTRNAVHEAIHRWLSGHGGFDDVRFSPSKIRKEQVVTSVAPSVLLGTDDVDANTTARLEVQFEFPQRANYDFYRIQWIEPDRHYSVGWHQDDHRNDLGECHLQLDYRDEVIDARPAEFLDSHPLNVLEARLEKLPSVLDRISWRDGEPEFDA